MRSMRTCAGRECLVDQKEEPPKTAVYGRSFEALRVLLIDGVI